MLPHTSKAPPKWVSLVSATDKALFRVVAPDTSNPPSTVKLPATVVVILILPMSVNPLISVTKYRLLSTSVLLPSCVKP